MARVLTPSLQAASKTVVQRIRELPVPGEITVEKGQEVSATSTIGYADLPGDLLILRISESLGIEALEVANGLQVAIGDEVQKDQLLCEHAGLFGLFRSRYVSPASGVVELIAEKTGHVALRQPSKRLEVDAYLKGKVVDIQDGKSVTIESSVSFLQGIFGVGGERHGTLVVIAERDEQLRTSHVPEQAKGKILVGGKKPSAEVLDLAAKRGAEGMIVGSIDDIALASYLGYDLGIALTGDEDVSMSLIITEGFGDLDMSQRSYELLRAKDNSEASLSGATQVRAGAVRPEVIIPISDSVENCVDGSPQSSEGLEPGARIRLIRVPYFGEIATVEEMPHQAEEIPSGAVTRVLRAKLDSTDELVTVPRANVELLT